MSRWRRLPGVLWLLYFALRNAVRAAYYLGAIPPVWTEEGLRGPWIYLGMAALAWALAFGAAAGLWWRRGPTAARWILGGMVLYQLHGWVHRLFLMRSPFIAQSHGFALLVSLLTLIGTAWFLGLVHGRSRV
ncbi:hypothetical protein [Thermoflexus sp.]|uniref:hypothetical protein n=1 Tax=Thermoflexus sp. TaxID=1969742 RepID=UPI0025E367C9|nr:hypothetical protein [Thermoflexus sp.]MDW8064656.1 hypothetical protein [Anaerolineae bacterium]MCS6963663.1 hypothetical protein [Thermoflexus sp.]MCS7350166.1 hypothetical protein [Thermoflexus sp.]MCX7689531.1 hypothetical protein [Thermoflexus sp.]MDW8179615.1 hypothetical protein [Anaerolineae bacterium]